MPHQPRAAWTVRMGRLFRKHGDHTAGPPVGGPGAAGSRAFAALLLLAATASCSPVNPDPKTSLTASDVFLPVTAQISQFRDNYSRQIIEIQLTNNTAGPLTVLEAELKSPLFSAGIPWQAPDGGIGLPPGQPKSLPAPLPAPACTPGSSAPGPAPATTTDAGQGSPATVFLRLAGPEEQTDQHPATVPAPDPYGALIRNNAEMCLAAAAAAVAGFGLEPELEESADGRTAVVRLTITPRRPGRPGRSAEPDHRADRGHHPAGRRRGHAVAPLRGGHRGWSGPTAPAAHPARPL